MGPIDPIASLISSIEMSLKHDAISLSLHIYVASPNCMHQTIVDLRFYYGQYQTPCQIEGKKGIREIQPLRYGRISKNCCVL